jgi:hypothetical protein
MLAADIDNPALTQLLTNAGSPMRTTDRSSPETVRRGEEGALPRLA